jgi:hypothetical protein
VASEPRAPATGRDVGEWIRLALDGFPGRYGILTRLLARGLFLRPMLRHAVIRQRLPAPRYLKPAVAVDDRAGFERLRVAIARTEAHTGGLHSHPALGRLSAAQWLGFHLWHCEHHLGYFWPRTGE